MGKKSKQQKKKQLRTTTKTPVGVARLQFPPGEKSGLTALALAVAADRNPPAIIREILQNSLDAAKAAKRECARVRFSVEDVDVSVIPGIAEYKKALASVGEFCEKTGWPSQSRDIYKAINYRLAKDFLPVLFVSDNGMGLDSGNMEALLSDGLNKKSNRGASGSHGNGHFTTFNLSDLRYLLYGGVSEADGKLASGHAVLAAHQNGKEICGKDGYFVADVRKDLLHLFEFPSGDTVPVISDKLQAIESEWGTGALIAVLDFNYFGRKKEAAADLILGAAARNFFVAIQRGDLVVEIDIGSIYKRLNADNLRETMENISPEIGNAPKFPRHEKAERFYRLFTESEKGGYAAYQLEVETVGGAFNVIYRESNRASTRIALCRNGMWITDDIPSITISHFAEYMPFEALVLCDDISACELVVLAEGNLHNSLHVNMVTDGEKEQKLRKSLQQIRKCLQEKIRKQSAESLDFLEIEGEGSIGISPESSAPKREKIAAARGSGGGLGTRAGRKSKSKAHSRRSTKPGNGISVMFTAVRDRNKMKIQIMPTESLGALQEAELRLILNLGKDFSCDNPDAGESTISLSKVVCDGIECAIDADKTRSRIGEIKESQLKNISVEFESPRVRGDYRVDCEFIRRERRS